MSNHPSGSEIALLRTAYTAFNARDVDAALATMAPDVAWPRAFKGGFVVGHDSVRAYWTEQWREINPTVLPVAFSSEEPGRVLVDVHQVVRDMAGSVMGDARVQHEFRIQGGLIASMELIENSETK